MKTMTESIVDEFDEIFIENGEYEDVVDEFFIKYVEYVIEYCSVE